MAKTFNCNPQEIYEMDLNLFMVMLHKIGEEAREIKKREELEKLKRQFR